VSLIPFINDFPGDLDFLLHVAGAAKGDFDDFRFLVHVGGDFNDFSLGIYFPRRGRRGLPRKKWSNPDVLASKRAREPCSPISTGATKARQKEREDMVLLIGSRL
jgi:hypothetical protein